MPAGTGTNGLPLIASGTPALNVTGTNSQATGTVASSSTALTLSAVVLLQPGTANSYAAVHLRGTTGTSAMLWVNKDTATGKWAMQGIVATSTGDTKYLWSEWDSIKPGTAAKVAVSADVVSHQARLWVNGVSQPAQAFTGNLVPADTITIGAERYNPTSTGQGWIGKITDVRLFSRTLTATQQLDLFTPSTWTIAPVTPPPAIDLTAYGAGFQQIQPVRILDTRSAIGIATTTPQNNVEVTVADGPGISSVAISITVLGTTADGWATVFPSGETDPGTSTITYVTNDLVSTATIARVSGDGKIRIKLNGTNTAHVLIDLFGFYGTGASVSVSANNKLVNGSFETGTSTTSATAWDINTVCGDAANQISLTRINAPADNIGGAADGNNYVRIQKNSATTAGSICQNLNYVPVSGQQYELSVMTRTTSGQTEGRGLVELWELGNANVTTNSTVSSNASVPFSTGATWQEVKITMCARNSQAFSLRVKVYPYSSGPVDIDQARLTITARPECLVNPGVPYGPTIPGPAPASILANGSMNANNDWSPCIAPSIGYYDGYPLGNVQLSVVPATQGSYGNALKVLRDDNGPTSNRACRKFEDKIPLPGTQQVFTAWVRSADQTNFPAHLEISGWIHKYAPACPQCFTDYLAIVGTSFTATQVWQQISVAWWAPTSGTVINEYTSLGTFQAAIVTDAANKGLLVDEASMTGAFMSDPYCPTGCPPPPPPPNQTCQGICTGLLVHSTGTYTMSKSNGLLWVRGTLSDTVYPNRTLAAYVEFRDPTTSALLDWDGVEAKNGGYSFLTPIPLQAGEVWACIYAADSFDGTEGENQGCESLIDIPQNAIPLGANLQDPLRGSISNFSSRAAALHAFVSNNVRAQTVVAPPKPAVPKQPPNPLPGVDPRTPRVSPAPPPSGAPYIRYLKTLGGYLYIASTAVGVWAAIENEATDLKNSQKNGVRIKIDNPDREGNECDPTSHPGGGVVCHFMKSGWGPSQLNSGSAYVHFLNAGYKFVDGKLEGPGKYVWKVFNVWGYKPGRVRTSDTYVNWIFPVNNISTRTIADFGGTAASTERDRATAANKPYTGIVGHLPDRVWIGMYPNCDLDSNCAGKPENQKAISRYPGFSDSWLDQDATQNQSFGRDSQRYPNGYVPDGQRVSGNSSSNKDNFRFYLMTIEEFERQTQHPLPRFFP